MQSVFGVNRSINLYFQDVSDIKDSYGNSIPSQITKIGGTQRISLSDNMLKNAAQEYIAGVTIHEIVHAYLNNNTTITGNLNQHQEMAQTYVDQISNTLRYLYPSLPLKTSQAMTIEGLETIINGQKPSYWAALLSKYGLNEKTGNDMDNNTLALIISRYSPTGDQGTRCD
ncbi:MAG: hypothetical protein ACTHJ5_08735 [Ilyomonas sp.]